MFSLSSLQFLLSYHTHLQLCSVPYWKHYCMPCVSKARPFFFGRDRTWHQGSGSTDALRLSQQAHSCYCYMNSWLLVLKNRSSGWLCLHLPSEAPGSAQHTHCSVQSMRRGSHISQEPNPSHSHFEGEDSRWKETNLKNSFTDDT